MKDWKSCERKVAALLGGRRVPITGRQRGDTPDIEHPTLSVECKSRKKFPAWLEDAIKQAQAAALDGQLPVVILHQDGRKYRDSFLLCRLGDFAAYLKERSG